MSAKDYRELQLSSSQLVLLFIAILALGIIIFLLGVSVGKKQTQILAQAEVAEALPSEPSPEKPAAAVQEPGEIKKELASHEKLQQKAAAEEAPEKVEKPAQEKLPPQKSEPPEKVRKQGLFWIQVGAYSNQGNAESVAAGYRNKGYRVLVIDPLPTDKRPIYRVRIGGYTTKEEAAKARDSLAQAENKKRTDYFIVRY